MAGLRFPESIEQLEDIMVRSLRERLGNAVSGFVTEEARDAPTPWLALEFRVFEYLPVTYLYDRGRGGFSVDFGSRRIGMQVPQPAGGLKGEEDVRALVDEFAKGAALWVPDKYLLSRGYGDFVEN